MVWCGIHYDIIIGPYFFNANVTSQTYLEVLEDVLTPYFDGLSLFSLSKTYFQQDGALAHFAKRVRDRLNHQLPGKWIGRRGPIEWRPRSPDLTPLDFFLWGHLKSRIYQFPLGTIQNLKDAITSEVTNITRETL